jgi:hypothetical protein
LESVREAGFVRIILVGLRIRLIVFVGHLNAPVGGVSRGKNVGSLWEKAIGDRRNTTAKFLDFGKTMQNHPLADVGMAIQ